MAPTATSTDVIIVGAGPAGVSTALHLLQHDPEWVQRVLVLEKAAHPRPKLCGGGVTRYGLSILQGLGIDLPLPLPQTEVENVFLRYKSRRIHVRGKPQFVVYQRAAFDALLTEKARQRGIRIHENEAVIDFSPAGDGVNITTQERTYQAKIVVGADGSKGIFRQRLHNRRPPKRVARLLEVHNPATGEDPLFTQKKALFDFTPTRQGLQGYLWDFPSWGGQRPLFNRGIYDSRAAPTRPRPKLSQLLDTALAARGVDPTERQLRGHPIHWFSPWNQFAAPHILLVGDAAGVEPLFGEGIGPALGYGEIAAQAIQQAFASQHFSFDDYRPQVLQSPLGHYLLIRWLSAWIAYRFSGKPWFMHALWTFGQTLAALWRVGEL
jgi:flavin-dependent dehydrogenase